MDTRRPLLTLALRSFNNAAFVEAALRGAFAQTYAPLDIVLTDDASTDGAFDIARRLAAEYAGPHRVVLSRTERNLGIGAHTDRILALSPGEIIVFADTDDISLPDRCERVYNAFREGGPGLLGVDSYFDVIDARGQPVANPQSRVALNRPKSDGVTAEMLARNRGGLQGAGAAFRRSVFERGVPLSGIRASEDLLLGFRCAVLGRTATIPKVLVLRRVHGHNLSGAIRASWTSADLKAWFLRHVEEKIPLPDVMCRDVDTFEREGLIPAERARRLRAEASLYARELHLLRMAPGEPWWRRWWLYFALRRLDMESRDALRLVVIATSPALAMRFVRRNPIYQARERQPPA